MLSRHNILLNLRFFVYKSCNLGNKMWYYINIKSLDVMHDLYIYCIHKYTWCILQLLLLIVYMQRYSHLKINSFLATFVRTLTQKITKIKKSKEVEAHRVLYFRIICYLMSSFINHTAFCRFQRFEKSSNDRHFPLCTFDIMLPVQFFWKAQSCRI